MTDENDTPESAASGEYDASKALVPSQGSVASHGDRD